LAAPIAGDGWLACGTAAMAFDPICGDGTAHAVREAILASAVIKAAMRGGDIARLVAHYENRLTAAFLRHLAHCVEYYAAVRGDWWEKEAVAAKAGIEWCSGRLGGDPKFHYRLNGLELEAID
jgi:flavin-dependent dehydrogenase